MRIARRASLAGAAFCLTAPAGPAAAHIVGARLGDFYAGALHPLTGIEDVVLWLALGVLAGSQGAARARPVVLVFPLGLLAGLAAGTAWGAPGAGPLADAGLMIALGLLLASARPMPAWAVAAAALLLALARGAANAAGLAPSGDAALYACGFALAGYAVVTLTMGATVAFRQARQAWRGIAVRAMGSWIAAVGLMLGGYALAAR